MILYFSKREHHTEADAIVTDIGQTKDGLYITAFVPKFDILERITLPPDFTVEINENPGCTSVKNVVVTSKEKVNETIAKFSSITVKIMADVKKLCFILQLLLKPERESEDIPRKQIGRAHV